MSEEFLKNPLSLFDIRGKTAIVTGATGAFGALASKVLAGAGANVVLCANNAAALEKVAAEFFDRRPHDRIAIGRRARPLGDDLGLAAERLAFGGDLLQLARVVRTKHHVGAGTSEDLRRHGTERAGGAGDDRGLAADVEERERVLQEVFRHRIARNLHDLDPSSGGPGMAREP